MSDEGMPQAPESDARPAPSPTAQPAGVPIPPRALQRLRVLAVPAQIAHDLITKMAAAGGEPIVQFQQARSMAMESLGLDPQDETIGLDLQQGTFVVPAAAPQPAAVQLPVPDAQS